MGAPRSETTGPFDEERAALARVCRRLAAEDLVIGTAGNVSVKVGERVVVTPTGGVFSELEPEQMTVVDLGGAVVDGALAPTSELSLHLGVYRRIDAARAVVHTHAPMATALACVVDEVPPIHYQMLALGGAVPVVPYATFGTEELADAVVETLSSRVAALMRNHGAVTWGIDLDGAVETALLLEWACALYLRARSVGEPIVLSDDQLADVVAAVQQRSYGAPQPVSDTREEHDGG